MRGKLVDLFSKKFQLQALYLFRIQLSTKLLAWIFAAVICLSYKHVKVSDQRDTAKF